MIAYMTAQYASAVPVAETALSVDIVKLVEPAPTCEETPCLEKLIDRICSNGSWLAKIAQKYDCTTKYVTQKLGKEIRAYCLTTSNQPSCIADLRA